MNYNIFGLGKYLPLQDAMTEEDKKNIELENGRRDTNLLRNQEGLQNHITVPSLAIEEEATVDETLL